MSSTKYAAKYSLYNTGSRVAGREVGNESDPSDAARARQTPLGLEQTKETRGQAFEVRKQQSWVNSRIEQEIGNHVDSQ